MREARRPRPGRTAAVPVDAREVLLAGPALLELADRLRDRRQPVDRDVLDAVAAVLADPESPLHLPTRDGALSDWAHALLAATDVAAMR